jgi:hypothetical protein
MFSTQSYQYAERGSKSAWILSLDIPLDLLKAGMLDAIDGVSRNAIMRLTVRGLIQPCHQQGGCL